ncbi:hypothetical protein SLEP1_g29462 [Rubroshorea leprosula]|uniref:non-specific serine/threonine protein kinase n=1 Tax=Rubroshorea leprosula TaxID=152421 RepID=A0AAV5K7M1_9ROSI|nr:hypothetical protein SLEP1_g29462 [Rubroshorea leprosula]
MLTYPHCDENRGIGKFGNEQRNDIINFSLTFWFLFANGVDPVKGVIWVANREKPLKDSSGTLMISEDGNLVVLNGQKEVLWSSNVEKLTGYNTISKLLDIGNLVGVDLRTGEKIQVTSWKSPSDPSVGNFSIGIEPFDIRQCFNWNNSQPYWRSGPWNGTVFVGVPAMNSFDLGCLSGFEPKNTEEWNRGIWTSGCVRSTTLPCHRTNSSREDGKEDGFLKLEMMKMPDFARQWPADTEDDAETEVLQWWDGSLHSFGILRTWYDILKLEEQKKDVKLIIIITTVIVGTIIFCICTLFVRRWMVAKGKAWKEKIEEMLFGRRKTSTTEVELQELPLFKFEELATATKNFNLANQLGQRGFGPVYRAKGTLENGQEITVKRLFSALGQGLEEFMNEVFVISELQQRNLVRLLGCCVENSRLRIVHKDLKASNILLDEELNPKISDFGMARIFRGNEDETNTRRVVGTYGYMSPKYAIVGLFSKKSNVFSYGVLLLEIVSGRRNTSFGNDEDTSSHLEYAWKLWNEENVLAMVDKVVCDPCHCREILRYIHVGLLCVQEMAKDRPTMSTVISMLNSEIMDLPSPKQPCFHSKTNCNRCNVPFSAWLTEILYKQCNCYNSSRPIRSKSLR